MHTGTAWIARSTQGRCKPVRRIRRAKQLWTSDLPRSY